MLGKKFGLSKIHLLAPKAFTENGVGIITNNRKNTVKKNKGKLRDFNIFLGITCTKANIERLKITQET